jgi:uridine kinase
VDLASRDAVDKALQRLTKAETLRRIDRGLYDQPGFNKLSQKPNPPDPRSVIDAVGRRDQTRMLVDGMTAANDLGLTDAIPAKIVVHTDARRRAIKLGNVMITFRQLRPASCSGPGDRNAPRPSASLAARSLGS